MAKAKKLPSGRWRCRAYSHTDREGKKHYKSFTASTKKEAEFMAAEFVFDRDRALDSSRWTLGEAIDKYIELKRPVLAPSTIYGYEQVRKTAFQSIMPIALDRLTPQRLQEAVNEELRRIPKGKHAPVSPKSVRNSYGLVSAVLKLYRPSFVANIDLPKQARRIRTLPEPKEIYEAVKGTDIELAVLLAMWLSFSMSEIRGLTKSKSIDGDYITIREVMVTIGGKDERKALGKQETRNRRHRMPTHVRELISQVNGDVIVDMPAKTILRHFRACLKRSGLPEMTFHDLRHVNASVMAALKIPDVYAQERGGWKTDHIMKTVYTEVFTAERQKVDKIIDGYFEKIVE